MNNSLYLETTQKLLTLIAKYAGFSPDLGLFDGKMGIAILLYHGAHHFCSEEMQSVADTLIDDIIDEKSYLYSLNSHSFNKGSSDIAWGFNHLMMNSFIDSDPDFFDDIDNLLFHDKTVISNIAITEYLFLGLYILSRYENSKNKNYWIDQANSYCNHIFKIVNTYPMLFSKRPDLLTPFWYSLLKWSEYKFSFIAHNEKIGKVIVFIKKFGASDVRTHKMTIADQFFYKFSNLDQETNSPEIKTIEDVNTIFFNKLLYPEMVLPPHEFLDEAMTQLILDNRLLNELVVLLNHRNIGISRYISGFAWSLLQYKSCCWPQ